MPQTNPYEAPSADLQRAGEADSSFELTAPRSVPIGRGWGWIAGGFDLFKRNPGVWILMIVILIIVSIVLSFIPIIGQLAVSLTTLVWMAGIMIGCRAQYGGKKLELGHLFAGFSGHAPTLILLSVLVFVVSTGIMLVAVGPIYLEILFGGPEPSPELMEHLADPVRFLLSFLVAMLVMIPLMMAAWFAVPLIALNDVPLLDALKLSFVGCLKNVLPFLLYGFAIMVLGILAIIPLALGLLVLAPVLYASIFVSYRDIFIK